MTVLSETTDQGPPHEEVRPLEQGPDTTTAAQQVVGKEQITGSGLGEYLDTVFGGTEGYAHIAVGIGGYFSKTGSYEFDQLHSGSFEWPAQRDELVLTIEKFGHEHDVYVCPYLMEGDKRRMRAAIDLRKVHADCDGQVDLDKVRKLDGFAIGSGTSGHAHVYVQLQEPVPLDQHRALCRALGNYLGDADAKIRPRDLLRPTGSQNQKGRARGEQSSPVQC